MRFSTCLAVSGSGAALSASNRKSRLRTRSPRCGRGRSDGGCIGAIASPCRGLGGSTVWACVGPANVSDANATAAVARVRNRGLMHPNLDACRAAARWQLRQAMARGWAGGRLALPSLEAALGLVDHVDAALAPDDAVVAVAATQ